MRGKGKKVGKVNNTKYHSFYIMDYAYNCIYFTFRVNKHFPLFRSRFFQILSRLSDWESDSELLGSYNVAAERRK